MNTIIETNNLSKSFGTVRAVDQVSLCLQPGEIYGFLGLNGAGKTSTIRLLLGMLRPTAGSAKVFGKLIGLNGKGPWERVGYMVEGSSAYPELTVIENLEIARRLHKIPDQNAVFNIIKKLQIEGYAHRKAGILSTGNMQRLGLARAMLHKPDLLILDEPVNGLDPAGVVEIRELLADLASQMGVTIFMSSHILTEVDRLATRIGIIHHGRLLQELDRTELAAIRAKRLEVAARDLDAARDILMQAGYQVEFSQDVLILKQPRALYAPERVSTILVQAGLPPTHIAIQQDDLEAHFLSLIGKSG
jgi:ABC-2 type transport system ATP-binding protein